MTIVETSSPTAPVTATSHDRFVATPSEARDFLQRVFESPSSHGHLPGRGEHGEVIDELVRLVDTTPAAGGHRIRVTHRPGAVRVEILRPSPAPRRRRASRWNPRWPRVARVELRA